MKKRYVVIENHNDMIRVLVSKMKIDKETLKFRVENGYTHFDLLFKTESKTFSNIYTIEFFTDTLLKLHKKGYIIIYNKEEFTNYDNKI